MQTDRAEAAPGPLGRALAPARLPPGPDEPRPAHPRRRALRHPGLDAAGRADPRGGGRRPAPRGRRLRARRPAGRPAAPPGRGRRGRRDPVGRRAGRWPSSSWPAARAPSGLRCGTSSPPPGSPSSARASGPGRPTCAGRRRTPTTRCSAYLPVPAGRRPGRPRRAALGPGRLGHRRPRAARPARRHERSRPRLAVAAHVVRHLTADPLLPRELLPADWPGARAAGGVRRLPGRAAPTSRTMSPPASTPVRPLFSARVEH